MLIAYVHSDFGHGMDEDGCAIYDKRLIAALSDLADVKIETIPIVRRRALGLPLWKARIDMAAHGRLRDLKAQGSKILISHEALFGMADDHIPNINPDMLIVHNYWPRFEYVGRPILSTQYRMYARQFLEKHLKRALKILFLADADFFCANEMMPSVIAGKTIVLAPPPRKFLLNGRSSELIHLSGSAGWRAKRYSRLTPVEHDAIRLRGYRIGDFTEPLQSAFGLITDRFAVGYKLKLMQMIYARDVIASFTDLETDVRQVAPDYPCYRTVSSINEALDYFDRYRDDVPERALESATKSLKGYTWDFLAKTIHAALLVNKLQNHLEVP